MQQFLVPQFIDVEDKIIGPITTRQFIIILLGVLITFLEYRLLAFLYFVVAGFITLAIFALLAFAKVNGRPIHFFILNFLQTSRRANTRVWNKASYVGAVHEVESEIKEKAVAKKRKKPVSGSRLADLSMIVNTGGVYGGGDNQSETILARNDEIKNT